MKRKCESTDHFSIDPTMLSEKEIIWKEALIELLANSELPYRVMEGPGVNTLKQMKTQYISLTSGRKDNYEHFFLNLLYYAFLHKNELALGWLLMELPGVEMFEPSYEIWSLIVKNYWIEGLYLIAECINRRKRPPSLAQLYQLPELLAVLKEKNCFPFTVHPEKDFDKLYNLLSCKWEHPVSQWEWCKETIPGVVEILKNTRSEYHGETLVQHFLWREINGDFVIEILGEFPEFLDIKDTTGRSALWTALTTFRDNPALAKRVFSFNKNPMVILGINDSHKMYQAGKALNNILFDNYTIQRLDFQNSYQTMMAKEYNDSGRIPAYFSYLERNRLLFLLLLSMRDKGSLFSSYLNLDLMGMIINQLIELEKLNPPSENIYLSLQSPTLIKKYENCVNGANWHQLYSKKEVPALIKILSAEWEQPLSIMAWYKENIEGFTAILKNARDSDGRTLLHKILRASDFNKTLFQNIVREVPELLDSTNGIGLSPIWLFLRIHSNNHELLKFVFSHKKDPGEIAGIHFSNARELEAGYSILNKLLAHNYRIQSLCFTETTKGLMTKHFNDSKNFPLFFNYLARNQLQLFLLLCMNDRDSTFLAPLNLDVMKVIIKKLIELIPHDGKRLLTSQRLEFFKPFEKTHRSEYQERKEQKDPGTNFSV